MFNATGCEEIHAAARGKAILQSWLSRKWKQHNRKKNLNWQPAWRTSEGSSVCTRRSVYLSSNTLDIFEIRHIYWPYKGFTAFLAILQRPPHFASHGRKVKLGCELLWCVMAAAAGDKVHNNCNYNNWEKLTAIFQNRIFYIKIDNYKK